VCVIDLAKTSYAFHTTEARIFLWKHPWGGTLLYVRHLLGRKGVADMKADTMGHNVCTLGKVALEYPATGPSAEDVTGNAAGNPALSKSSPPWSQRYMLALERYEKLDVRSRQAVVAVVEGLRDWAALVPQRAARFDGTSMPVNKWSLGAERTVIHAICSHLVMIGKEAVAARIGAELANLLETVESLDRCCQEIPRDEEAEARLAGTARIQARALAQLLANVHTDSGAFSSSTGPATKPIHRRGAPKRQDIQQDQQLLDEWSRIRGVDGMTRKEFCVAKQITLRAFIQAQDRVRKHASQAAEITT